MSQSPSSKSAALFQEALNAEARQDYFEALSKYTASLSLDGNQVPTWVRIGKIFLRTMKYQQARETMEFVLGMDPHNVDAIYGLAISYFYLGKLEEARAFIDQAVQMQPDNATYAAPISTPSASPTPNASASFTRPGASALPTRWPVRARHC